MKIINIFLCLAMAACGSPGNFQDTTPIETQPVRKPIPPAQPPNPLPPTTCKTNVALVDSSAWLITKPKVNLVFWGSWWVTGGLTTYGQLSDTWGTLLNNSMFYSVLQEYGSGDGRLASISVTYPTLPVGALNEGSITNELTAEIGNTYLPQPDNQSLYVVILPPSTYSQLDRDNNWGGHHSALFYSGTAFSYSVVDFNDVFRVNISISHEIYESITDPDTSTGYHDQNGSEVGDLCNGIPYNLSGIAIQKVWSQKKCSCIP